MFDATTVSEKKGAYDCCRLPYFVISCENTIQCFVKQQETHIPRSKVTKTTAGVGRNIPPLLLLFFRRKKREEEKERNRRIVSVTLFFFIIYFGSLSLVKYFLQLFVEGTSLLLFGKCVLHKNVVYVQIESCLSVSSHEFTIRDICFSWFFFLIYLISLHENILLLKFFLYLVTICKVYFYFTLESAVLWGL